jgi:hypothetical protein
MANVEIMRGQRTVATGLRKGSDEWRNASRVVDREQKAVLTLQATLTHPHTLQVQSVISSYTQIVYPCRPLVCVSKWPNHKA